jgi:hypothetical protein
MLHMEDILEEGMNTNMNVPIGVSKMNNTERQNMEASV